MDEAEHCHRLAFIQRGELIAAGSPQTLKETMMEGRVVQIYPSDSAQTVQSLRKASKAGDLPLGGVALYGAFVHVVLRDDTVDTQVLETFLKAVDAEVELYSIREIEPSLEDVFIACMD
jgi:ABC-2 type transport system ATP-binding protein